MGNNVFNLIANSKRNSYEPRYITSSKHRKVSSLFAGAQNNMPELFGIEVLNDISNRIALCEQMSGVKIRTKLSIEKSRVSAVYEDRQEAEILFFLQIGDQPKQTAPFLMLSARHIKDDNTSNGFKSEYLLMRRFGKGSHRSRILAKGDSYNDCIASAISNKFIEELNSYNLIRTRDDILISQKPDALS